MKIKEVISLIVSFSLLMALSLATLAVLYVKKTPQILSDSLSRKMHCQVHVGAVEITLHSIIIRDFSIENPKDSLISKALYAKTITILASPLHFLRQNIEVELIAIDDIDLGLEFDNPTDIRGNWTRLMENFYTQADDEIPSEASRTLFIKKIDLQNISTQVVYLTNPEHRIHLKQIPLISLTNVSSHGGLPIDQLLNSVLGEMLLTVFKKENLRNMLQELLNPANTVKKLLSPFKSILP